MSNKKNPASPPASWRDPLQTAGSSGRVERLAAALLRDRERPASTNIPTEACFTCGRAYMRRSVNQRDVAAQCRHVCRSKCLINRRCAGVPSTEREASHV